MPQTLLLHYFIIFIMFIPMIDIILGKPERSRIDPILLNFFFNNNLQFGITNTFNKQLLKEKMLKCLIT